MHKLERNEVPKKLEKANIEYLNKIATNPNVDNTFNQTVGNETRKSLIKMTGGYCAYCESYIEDGIPNIEHIIPKSKEPKLAYEYSNLVLVCPVCNLNKGDKYSENFIDPTKEDPEKHIKFEGQHIFALDEKGRVTIEMLQLDSEIKNKARKEKLKEVRYIINDIIQDIQDLEDNKISKEVRKYILKNIQKKVLILEGKMQHGSEYCTMVKHNCSKIVIYIKEIIKINEEKIKNK